MADFTNATDETIRDHARATEGPSYVDRVFAPPLECVMDLPFPPSTNKLWRQARGRVILSKTYKAWKAEANASVVANGCWRHRIRMPAAFTALLLLDRGRRTATMDVDNRGLKACLDWAQSMELVVNDCWCEEATARWVSTAEAPRGARLILRSVIAEGYHGQRDMTGSLQVAFDAVKARVAAGGPPWTPGEAKG